MELIEMNFTYYERKILRSLVKVGFTILISILTIIAAWNGILKPGNDSSELWFQRSGSIATVLAVIAELFVYRSLSFFGELGEIEASEKFKRAITVTKFLTTLTLIVGTVIWGYGDLLHVACNPSS